MTELLKETYRNRELIWALALKELKIRYKRSVLGFLWALLNPLLLMLVLTAVFSTVMVIPIQHYAIFLLSVLLPWTFFSQSLSYAAESIVGNADLIKKVRVSKLVFPVAALISNMINLLLSLIPLALIVLVMRHHFYWTWIYLPIPLIALTILTLGATFFFATANVYYRDVGHISADSFAGLVLCNSDHLQLRHFSEEMAVAFSFESSCLCPEWISHGDLQG